MNAKFVHALCEFACDGCGGPALMLARAPVSEDGRICGDADKPTDAIECAACRQKRRQREVDTYDKERERLRQQRAWARGEPA